MWNRAGAVVRFVAVGWLVLLLGHAPTTQGVPGTSHGYEMKSFAQAYLECLQYLNVSRQSMYSYDEATPAGKCLMRCIGLNMRWWNDLEGLDDPALVRFFRRTDEKALQRARSCLEEIPESSDVCAAAYTSFRCYSIELGELIAHPRYVTPQKTEIRQAVIDCAQMVQVSEDQLSTYVAAESLQDDSGASSLLRCIIIRLGLYTDYKGIMADRLQALFGENASRLLTVEQVALAKQCEVDLRESGLDVFAQAAQSVEICYGREVLIELWKALTESYDNTRDVFAIM
ncbi:general odorant-binding protein 45-like [Anopheles nili]|uniref:general odorant-binding protein 45-like n=1 Tax=Anopheles nili TaxID=185578 RepID=UPI00237B1E3A|nr:general odorant-binding protein 45-like [Anopheles nili]